MAHPDSFAARSTLRVGEREYEIFRLDALQARYDVFRLPYTLRDPARERPAPRGRRDGHDRRRRGRRHLGREGASRRARSPTRPRACSSRTSPACPRSSTWPRCAHAMDDLGGDAKRINPLLPVRARDRPLGAGGRVRQPPRDRPQRRARVRAQPRALRVPALGADRVRGPLGRPAEHRDRPPGQPRVPRAAWSRRGTGRPSRTRSSAPTRTRR